MSDPQSHSLNDNQYLIKDVYWPDEHESQDIWIIDGILQTKAATRAHEASKDVITIETQGCIVVPGLVDLYSRCREPGLTRKGSIASESLAALSAGFTHVLCSPDTAPAVDNVATVELIHHRSQSVSTGATIIPMAALTVGLRGEQLSELATLQAAGCAVASQADRPILSTTVLYSAMQYAASFDMPLLLTARDPQLGVDGCAHNGAVATRLGLPVIPVAAETVDLARIIELCRETLCPVHVSRISSKRAVQQISEAKQAGLPITCDVGIHHLFFTDDLLEGYDASFHCAVPFRGKQDRQALRDALYSGVIDAICSDHAPHDIDAGLAPFPVTEPGLSAYRWFIPLLLQLPQITGLSLSQLIDKLHTAPAQILGRSTTMPGNAANFSLLDTNAEFQGPDIGLLISGGNHPLARHSPESLDLAPLKGRITAAFNAGRATIFQ